MNKEQMREIITDALRGFGWADYSELEAANVRLGAEIDGLRAEIARLKRNEETIAAIRKALP